MKGQILRPVAALVAALALVMAIAGPAMAVNGKSGTTSCPSRYSYLQYRFMVHADGKAPGGTSPGYGPSIWVDTGYYWSTLVKAGLIGGGYWWVEGEPLDDDNTFGYCN